MSRRDQLIVRCDTSSPPYKIIISNWKEMLNDIGKSIKKSLTTSPRFVTNGVCAFQCSWTLCSWLMDVCVTFESGEAKERRLGDEVAHLTWEGWIGPWQWTGWIREGRRWVSNVLHEARTNFTSWPYAQEQRRLLKWSNFLNDQRYYFNRPPPMETTHA